MNEFPDPMKGSGDGWAVTPEGDVVPPSGDDSSETWTGGTPATPGARLELPVDHPVTGLSPEEKLKQGLPLTQEEARQLNEDARRERGGKPPIEPR